jgi:ankyrin repeat protein
MMRMLSRTPKFPISLRILHYDENEEIFRLLLEHGALINGKEENGKTALVIAVEQGNLKAAEFLRQNGAKD